MKMKCVNKNKKTPQVLSRRSIIDKQDANCLINNTPEGSKGEHGGQGRSCGRSGGYNFNSNLKENQHKSIAGETSNRTRFGTRDSEYTQCSIAKLDCVVPDVVVGDDEGFAEWLGGVEPDSRVFLCCGGRLTRDGA